jgi:hypothetical protein
MRLPAVFFQPSLSFLYIFHTERNVIHDAPGVLIGVGLHVKHVLHPGGAVGNLHRNPIGFGTLHSALPVQMEAEDVAIEMIFDIAIMHDEADVDDVV